MVYGEQRRSSNYVSPLGGFMGQDGTRPSALASLLHSGARGGWTARPRSVVSKGLPITSIHHAAWAARSGMDPLFPEFTAITGCSKSMMARLSGGRLMGMIGQVIHGPRGSENCPDRDRLAFQFE